MRTSSISRQTNETRVQVSLALDGTGSYEINTGLGFLDHMLTQVAVHGGFDLNIKAEGDLHVDPHHTVEDVAITLGQAFFEALGDRRGITRMASVFVPMDDALGLVVVDLSGRPYTFVQAVWHGERIGEIPTSLIPHFLESFATAARCNLHAHVLYGRDDHHQAEALFKGLGRSLAAAVKVDGRMIGSIPSSKGFMDKG
jgi:imidazoleglycerol-phosphate dehydratase